MIFRIVDPDTGEILDREFLVEKEAIRNFKIKAKRLNAVIRQIGEKNAKTTKPIELENSSAKT